MKNFLNYFVFLIVLFGSIVGLIWGLCVLSRFVSEPLEITAVFVALAGWLAALGAFLEAQ